MVGTGPAYWVVVLGPEKLGRLLGYIMGWSTVACWFFISAVCNLFLAQLIVALAQATHPDYVSTDWHVYLVYAALAINAFMVCLPKAHKFVGWCLSASVVFINAAALFIFIALLVKASPKQSARKVFVDIVNETGWGSNVVVFFLSILPGIASVGGIDSATHLADEMDDPGRQIPIVMMGSASLSFLVGIPSIIIYLFCTVDQAALLTPVGGQPIIQLFRDSFESTALTITATLCIIISFAVANWAALTSWSRLYWSFSRDGGLPFSSFTAKLSKHEAIPVNALLVCTVLNLLIGLLQLGASTALNALLGGASLCGKSSWALCFAMLFWRGRDSLRQDRWLNLGKLGLPIDIIAFTWSIWVCVWLSFPLYIPVTPRSMNYASVVFAGICAISAGYYFLVYSKKKVLPAMLHRHETTPATQERGDTAQGGDTAKEGGDTAQGGGDIEK